MSRRRLRVVCSSDEEDEDLPPPPPPPQEQQQPEDIDDLMIDDIETDFQTVNLNSANPTPSTNNSTTATQANRYGSRQVEPIPLDISDEEQENIDVNDSANNSSSGNANGNSYFEVSESPVHGVLERLGLKLRKEWLDSCLHGLQSSVQGFQRMDDSAKAKLCFGQFLWSDMNYCGAGVLPPNVHTLHLVDLKGPFVLQVDEIINMSKPLRERYQPAAPGIKRCLKLSMTDGVQRVFGIEYRPIKDLDVLAPAGLKVAVCNVNIRRGFMVLVPENIEFLGGTVKELQAAQQRLVDELNKPARGKRTRTGVVPPLATRATLAAWPPSNNAAPGHVERNLPINTMPIHACGRGSAVGICANDMHGPDFATPSSRNNAEPNTSGAPWPQEQAEVPRHTDMPTGTDLRQGPNSPRRDFEVLVSRSNAEPTTLSAVQPLECVTIRQHIDEPTTEVMAPPGGTRQVTLPGIPANCMPGDSVNVPDNRDNDEPNTSSMHMDVEEIPLLDDLENQFILSRDNEIPFTYLASLSAKFAANDDETSVVRGKIKCFVTGVKGFQFKERSTYELQVYVDDGSLISEILIDHNVVQNGIGYSPQEVTNALVSSERKRVSKMKEILKKFQIFLVDFEGTMLIEMSKASAVPVAVEMSQGCPASDAWLLLRRVNSFSSAQQQNQSHLESIDLSP